MKGKMMSIKQLIEHLRYLSKLAKKKGDINTALKAAEMQLKYLIEQRNAIPVDVNLMSDDEINQLIQSAEKSKNQ